MLKELNGDPLPWLLEKDVENPGVRYFAFTELLGKDALSPEAKAAHAAVMQTGHVPRFLAAQKPDGFWVTPGPGYAPKYTGTVWSLIFLAQLGADGEHPEIRKACAYVLDHSRAPSSRFSATGTNSGAIHCLEGNLVAALIDYGWLGDERLEEAIEWLARSITGQGMAPSNDREAAVRYLRSGNSGPGFECAANNLLPCAWGAVKAMLALSRIPAVSRSPQVRSAIEVGADFLLGTDPAAADYPMGYSEKPSGSWFKFGFPVGYITDVLQTLEVLTALGYGTDSRLSNALELMLSKQDAQGRWRLEYSNYAGKSWSDIEEKGQLSKWVTLRALRVLHRVGLAVH